MGTNNSAMGGEDGVGRVENLDEGLLVRRTLVFCNLKKKKLISPINGHIIVIVMYLWLSHEDLS